MSNTATKIEWTDTTWNPTTGCDRVSPGCDHCYALTLAKRLKAMGNPRYQNDGREKTSGPGFGLTLHPDLIEEPLKWRKPRRVFVNSMSDLFHDDVPEGFIRDVFSTMAEAPQHVFQVLTKRPRRMLRLMQRGVLRGRAARVWPLPNVWLGTSVEDQKAAESRIPLLRQTPAAIRFLSCEPLIGPVSLRPKRARTNEVELALGALDQELTKAHAEWGDFVIFGSAVMYLHGLRETVGDIDVFVTRSVYERLKDDPRWTELTPREGDPPLLELTGPVPLHVFYDWTARDKWMNVEEVFRTARNVDGWNCASLAMVRMHKRIAYENWEGAPEAQEKHVKDIAALDNALGIDWVIAGGESGPKARPMHPEWVRALRDECVDNGVAFFFKQWGGRTPKAGGRELDGQTWDEFPEAVS